MEIWKPVKNFESFYQVSNTGKVRSLDRIDRLNRYKKGVLKKLCDNGRGYLYVNLKAHGKQTQKTVHRLVSEAFIPNPDNLPEVNHLDGDKTNNSVNNLEWCTRSENMKHAFRNELNKQYKGVNNPQAKLTEKDVIYIRNNYIKHDKNFGAEALARKFNVSATTIKMALWRKHYASIL